MISLYGDQIAFVQHTGTTASLVLLKWSASASVGTIGAPTAPTSVAAASYRTCTAPCMTVMALSANPNDTTSSPFYDYANDVLYVGADNGTLHKFTGAFNGTPAEVVSSGANVWPAAVSTTALTSPVFDSTTNYAGGETAAARLLVLPERATAALCFNDVVAIGLIRALTEIGISIGRDFAVIGFDDIDEAKHTLPALTSVAVNARNLGSRAAQLLMRQIASGNFEPENVLCPTSLIIRSSCGTGAAKQEGMPS